jgi:23S rRNA pseudouridine955/2504/2580 synthase
VDAPVLTHARAGGERVVRVHQAGKVALSTFAVVEHYANLATLMDVAIHTGRTHQIRVHAAFAGHPVAGDDKYGDREANSALRRLGLRRMFLHAASIGFRWPDSGAFFRAEAPLPADLAAVLARLRDPQS